MALKVLMFGWEFPPHFSGGLGVACHGLTKALAQADDVEITFVLPKKIEVEETVETFLFADDYTHTSGTITLKTINSLLRPYISPELYETELSKSYTQGTLKRLYGASLEEEVYRYAQLASQLAKEEDFDIIHGHDWLTAPAAMEAQKVSQKPFVFHIHATEVDRTGGNVNQTIYDIERQALHTADCVVAVSEHTKKTVCRHYGVDWNNVEVVHNGIEYDSFKYAKVCDDTIERLESMKAKGYQIVLFVGRLTMQKGIEYLIKAAEKVVKERPKTIFLIAGTGDLHQKLLEMTARMGISDKVIFAGWIRGKQLTALYQVADLFIMPSVSEPFGLVALEAAVHETPVILSKTSGAAEVIEHAIKTDFWDDHETAVMIFGVLEHQALHKILKHSTHQQVQEISWDAAATKLRKIYHTL